MTKPQPDTSPSFLEQCGGFTPAPDILVNEYGNTTAHIWGIIWRYCQGKDGICNASNQTIADRAGVSHRCVWTHIKRLIDDGFIQDFDPGIKNRPHRLCTKTGEEKIKGMQNLPTNQDEGMQELPSGYAKNAEQGMQNLQEKIVVKDSITTITTTPAQELATYFTEQTSKQPRGIIDSQEWEDDCQDILDKIGGDLPLAKDHMSQAIVTLTELNYTYKTPASLINTIDKQLQPKPKRSQNGRKPISRAAAQESDELGQALAEQFKVKGG